MLLSLQRFSKSNKWTSVLIIIRSLIRSRRIELERLNMKSTTVKNHGFTLVEIMIVVAIIGLLAAIAIPNFVKARTTSQQNACINNLRLVDSSKQQWALETHQTTGAAAPSLTTDLTPYIKLNVAGSI